VQCLIHAPFNGGTTMAQTTPKRTLPALLWALAAPLALVAAPAAATSITYDFLDLVESQSTVVTAQRPDGTVFTGIPEEGRYRWLSWDQNGLTVTASTEFWEEDDNGEVVAMIPAYVYLEPDFAGLGTCHPSTNPLACSAGGTQLGYQDRFSLEFSEVVEIVEIQFSTGEDDSQQNPDDDDYRAYNTRLLVSGGPVPVNDLMGQGVAWFGSMIGSQIEFYRPEGTGFYIESIRVKRLQVPEPASLGLLLTGVSLIGWRMRMTARL